jgi:hypothetical protein
MKDKIVVGAKGATQEMLDGFKAHCEQKEPSAVKADLSDAEIAANEGDFSVEEVTAMLNSRTPAMQGLLTAKPDEDDDA